MIFGDGGGKKAATTVANLNIQQVSTYALDQVESAWDKQGNATLAYSKQWACALRMGSAVRVVGAKSYRCVKADKYAKSASRYRPRRI